MEGDVATPSLQGCLLSGIFASPALAEHVIACGQLAAPDLANLCLVCRELRAQVTDDAWCAAVRSRWNGIEPVIQCARR